MMSVDVHATRRQASGLVVARPPSPRPRREVYVPFRSGGLFAHSFQAFVMNVVSLSTLLYSTIILSSLFNSKSARHSYLLYVVCILLIIYREIYFSISLFLCLTVVPLLSSNQEWKRLSPDELLIEIAKRSERLRTLVQHGVPEANRGEV